MVSGKTRASSRAPAQLARVIERRGGEPRDRHQSAADLLSDLRRIRRARARRPVYTPSLSSRWRQPLCSRSLSLVRGSDWCRQATTGPRLPTSPTQLWNRHCHQTARCWRSSCSRLFTTLGQVHVMLGSPYGEPRPVTNDDRLKLAPVFYGMVQASPLRGSTRTGRGTRGTCLSRVGYPRRSC